MRKPASEGDPYSQYVLAWVELLSGNQEGYLELLNRAARAGFSPAIMDLATALQRSSSVVASSLKMLTLAASKGHLIARGRMFLLWIRGRFGWIYIIPGLLGFAINWVRVILKYGQDPLSPYVLCISSRLRAPPIRRQWHREATEIA